MQTAPKQICNVENQQNKAKEKEKAEKLFGWEAASSWREFSELKV